MELGFALKRLLALLIVAIILPVSTPHIAIPVEAQTQGSITIDGDLGDWQGVYPLNDTLGDPGLTGMDIAQVYVTSDDTYVYFRVDYAAPPASIPFLWANITLRNENGTLFMVMASDDSTWDFVAVFHGISLTETDLAWDLIASHNQAGFAAMSEDMKSLEFKVPKTDLQVTQRLDYVFWDTVPGYGSVDKAPDTGYATYFLARPVIRANIDIKPGGLPNSINTKKNTTIPVALLGSTVFNVEKVDTSSLRFGPAGAQPTGPKISFEDVDNDGYLDMILHFDAKATGLATGDTTACLTGLLQSNPFKGCDSVRIVK